MLAKSGLHFVPVAVFVPPAEPLATAFLTALVDAGAREPLATACFMALVDAGALREPLATAFFMALVDAGALRVGLVTAFLPPLDAPDAGLFAASRAFALAATLVPAFAGGDRDPDRLGGATLAGLV